MVDAAATAIAIIGLSMPDFWLAYVLIWAFALSFNIFPSYGFVPPLESLSGALYSGFLPGPRHRGTDGGVLHPHPARLPGRQCDARLRPRRPVLRLFAPNLVFVHFILRNALIPYVTVIGLQIRYLLGGTVVIERIFGIPGLGALIVDATFARDFPVIEACVVTFLLGVISVNMAVDIICGLLNPRTR